MGRNESYFCSKELDFRATLCRCDGLFVVELLRTVVGCFLGAWLSSFLTGEEAGCCFRIMFTNRSDVVLRITEIDVQLPSLIQYRESRIQ